MRLITLLLGLAALAWVIYTYQGSGSSLNATGDKTVKQQAVESIEEAKQASSALQQSINEQTQRLQQANE